MLLRAIALALVCATPLLQAAPKVALELVADGLTSPLSFASLPGGRALIVDQPGYVRLLEKPGRLREQPVLNLTNRLSALNHGGFDERGVLGLALHPDFARNRRVFIAYTAPRRESVTTNWDCTLRVSEFLLPAAEPLAIDAASETIRLEVDKPYANHNGGRIAFGPDGFLYVGVGDGGNGNDEDAPAMEEKSRRPGTGNGQNLRTLLGKILRIDVNVPKGHGIPKDNPFADGVKALPEIWAYGIRNPWGLGFDLGADHALYAADVGQTLWEEVNRIERGGNYGWRLREGFTGFNPKAPEKSLAEVPATGASGEPLIGPIAQYKNRNGFKKDADAHGISVTGGYIYRGKAFPALEGDYVFGDWARIWGVPAGTLLIAHRPKDPKAAWTVEPLELAGGGKVGGYVIAFGQDADGEVYVMTNGNIGLTPGKGRVWKIITPAAATQASAY